MSFLWGAGAMLPIVSSQATFRPRAHDEDLQRELAAMHRCDAICAISQEEEQLVQDYGIPSWKAPIERDKQIEFKFNMEKPHFYICLLFVMLFTFWCGSQEISINKTLVCLGVF